MRKFIDILSEQADIEQDRIRAFKELANAQRDKPEMAMVGLQHALGGGVLSWMVEHVGDLTHRMTMYPDRISNCGYEFVKPKVDRAISVLTSGYGFDREFRENMKANAKYRNISLEEHMKNVDQALQIYANAHRALRVYNDCQKNGRDAAVALGEMKWNDCLAKLRFLQKRLIYPETWKRAASQFDPNYL